ncbi:hypothetical protein EYC84_008622 [Monilinia fructicola]|uniref:Uncharacterized protein n=1 Tax=Monilinia fructicola TaxID=38448 RepID=A0A5M9JG12_MONFR|nr:hypothetical protein EYC84_008622 [Monilinia fructicola]
MRNTIIKENISKMQFMAGPGGEIRANTYKHKIPVKPKSTSKPQLELDQNMSMMMGIIPLHLPLLYLYPQLPLPPLTINHPSSNYQQFIPYTHQPTYLPTHPLLTITQHPTSISISIYLSVLLSPVIQQ